MSAAVEHCCEEMARFVADVSLPLDYNDVFREYGIRYLDGGSAVQLIVFCPWSGTRLPDSLRDAWFDAIAELGFEPDDPDLPAEFRSGVWWRERGL